MKGFSVESAYEEMEHLKKLPDRIWEKKGIAIVAPGNLACTYALKKRASALGKEEWLFTCPITEREYSLGKQGKKISETIEKALRKRGIKGIIVYASCMEVLTQWSLEEIREKIKNPDHIPIEILYRGPLAKRKKAPGEVLEDIWKRWEIKNGEEAGFFKQEIVLKENTEEIPDFQAVIEALENRECDILLITPGGCKSALTLKKQDNCVQEIKSTRFSDVFASKGNWEGAEKEIFQNFPENRPLFLVGSAVPKAIGLDLQELAYRLEKMGKSVAVINCTGFRSAAEMKLDISEDFDEKVYKFLDNTGEK